MQKYWNTVQDEQGRPRYGALVAVQQSGVNSSIFSDSAGLVPAANPLTTDATRGYFEFYVAAGAYDLVVSGVGFASYTITNGAEVGLPSTDVTFMQSGTRPLSGTVAAGIWDQCVNVKNSPFLAVGDGTTDDTTAINAAIAVAASTGKSLFFPAGTYKVTSTLTTIAGQMTVFGEGPFKSIVSFAPTAADTLFYLDNGASKTTHIVMRDLGIYSTDTTYAKVGIDGRDLSVCFFERIYIRGTGMASGPGAGAGWSDGAAGSIGMRFNGREAVTVRGVEIIADKPIYFAANPNTAATDGEDCDHFHFQDCYFVGNGNPLVEFAAGLGASELTFDGFQAWVGGKGGLKINDTRVAPNVPSRGIKCKNVRYEQCTDATKYAFLMTFTEPVQTMKLENVVMASTSNGISIDGFSRLVLDEVTGAMTSTQLLVANATSKTVLSLRGCIWQSGGTFTTTGLTRVSALAYDSTDYSAPSDAIYVGALGASSLSTGLVTATVTATTAGFRAIGGDFVEIVPNASGNGGTVKSYDGNSTARPLLLNSSYVGTNNKIYPSTDGAALQTAAGIYAGTGVPNNANGSNGDFYFRSDGGAGTSLYMRRAGAWVGIV